MDLENVASLILHAALSLRYELVCGAVLFALWLMGSMAGIGKTRHPPHPGAKLEAQAVGKKSAVGNKPSYTSRPPNPSRSVSLKALDVSESFSALRSTDELSARLNSMDQAMLCDPAWVAPLVTHLCRTQTQYAFTVYRAAMQAGLKLQDVATAERRQLFMMLVTSAIRICQIDEVMLVLKDLRHHGIGVNANLFASAVKLCTSKHLFTDCLAIYDFVKEDASFEVTDKTVWSCLMFCSIESRAYQRCEHFFNSLKACGTPSHKDYGNMVRLASLHGDWQSSLRLIQEMRDSSIEIDSVIYNTSLATCVGADQVDQARRLLEEMVKADGVADVITYNTLMKGYAKAGRMDQCFDVFELLQKRKITPSQVTYGILMDGCINENLLDRAAAVFNNMVSSGCAMNTVLFTTLIKGFARAGEVDKAMKIYEKMHSSVPPDLITFSILIKANCDSDRLEEALKLLEAMLGLGLRPDEVVFNNLLAGCARQANLELGKRLYADMTASGIRPSNATFSILIRFYHQCKVLEEAVDMLSTEPAKHKVDPEPRLYLQLIQSCIRERQGRRAVDVYQLMLQRSTPTMAAHSSMMTTCIKLNMYDTAAEILAKTAEHGGRVDANDASCLLEGAVRKRKFQVASDCAASMEKLGIPADPKFLSQVKHSNQQ